jgi:hypothetical protein
VSAFDDLSTSWPGKGELSTFFNTDSAVFGSEPGCHSWSGTEQHTLFTAVEHSHEIADHPSADGSLRPGQLSDLGM